MLGHKQKLLGTCPGVPRLGYAPAIQQPAPLTYERLGVQLCSYVKKKIMVINSSLCGWLRRNNHLGPSVKLSTLAVMVDNLDECSPSWGCYVLFA